MVVGFTIAEVRFRGRNVPDASVTFSRGLSVVAGPSNTGKSLIRAAINYVFGAGEPMTTVEESKGYESIFVQIRTHEDKVITFERQWAGGDIRQYMVPAAAIGAGTPSTILSAKHSAERVDNISAVLLNTAGMTGIRLRKKQTGELRNLSFRDFVEYALVSEERIITTHSPIHSGSPIDKTYESSLFRWLLTGQDDSDLIVAPTKKNEKASIAGQTEAIEKMKSDLVRRMPADGRTEDDLKALAARIDERIAEQSRILQSYRADLAQLEQQRRENEGQYQRTRSRLAQIDSNMQRFKLLEDQYLSDLRRLQGTVEAGNLFADRHEGPCPICGADPEHHKQHGITPEQVEIFTAACEAEAQKIQVRRTDLASTIAALASERAVLGQRDLELKFERANIAQAFEDVLGPSITGVDGTLTDLTQSRSELTILLTWHEQIHRLEALQQAIALTNSSSEQTATFASLPPESFERFATTVEEILRAWSFPELQRVVYDPKSEDIVVSGKARKDNGKGYRAITYAAYMTAVLLNSLRSGLPHPGLLLLDSPLVTYREPDEHMGDVKQAFYEYLATAVGNAQVIILENEDPPESLKSKIAFTGFTKNAALGRYGLLPPSHMAMANEVTEDAPE